VACGSDQFFIFDPVLVSFYCGVIFFVSSWRFLARRRCYGYYLCFQKRI